MWLDFSTRFADPVPTASLSRLASEFLLQGQRLIASLDDSVFADALPTMSGSPIGAHIRHALDHFTSLLDGLESGTVDYDLRARDTDVERDRTAAIAAIHGVQRRLATASARVDRDLWVLVDSGERGSRTRSRSTAHRELQFCIAHTVHHYAIVALLLRARGIEVESGFGVAPSTQKHEARQRAEHESTMATNGESLASCAR